MNVGTAHSDGNPTHFYLNSKGIWLTYIIMISLVHFMLLSVPFFSVPIAWTLTNVVHDVLMFMILHVTKGTPWEPADQGKARMQTQWEQIDYGQQFTATKKFLTTVPILFIQLVRAEPSPTSEIEAFHQQMLYRQGPDMSRSD